jgi:hypothetical protein
MISKVASFADYDGGDVMNICLAVGRKESAVVRQACLRNNLGHLEHCLKSFAHEGLDRDQMKVNISCWMEVNTDWRKLCTKERAEDDGLSTPLYENEDGKLICRTDPLVIFNNPAVAIEFGIIDVLKHLVEEVGIGINACKWNGYGSRTKSHLLYLSFLLSSQNDGVSKSIIEYIVSREDVNVCDSAMRGGESHQVWHGILFDKYNDHDLASFEAVIQHRSFDPNRASEVAGVNSLPLHHAISFIIGTQLSFRATNIAMEKVESLLKLGADPKLAIDALPSPLGYAQVIIHGAGSRAIPLAQSLKIKLCKSLISMMEKYTDCN